MNGPASIIPEAGPFSVHAGGKTGSHAETRRARRTEEKR
jgi:hypothetical protein